MKLSCDARFYTKAIPKNVLQISKICQLEKHRLHV